VQDHFFKKNPALLLGVMAYLGATYSLTQSFIALIPALLLFYLTPFSRFFYALLLFFLSFFLTSISCTMIKIPPEGLKGEALFIPESVLESKVSFQKGWIYKGKIAAFYDQEGKTVLKHVPCQIKMKGDRLKLNRHLLLAGTLYGGNGGSYFLRTYQNQCKAVDGTHCFAEWRFHLKNFVKKSISQNIASPESASFLAGLATGDFENQLIQKELGRFGLQHIMAISGFHFSLIAAMLTYFLKPFFAPKKTVFLLMILLSLYFLFLGLTPSILRAFVMILMSSLGVFFGLKTSALNTLGIALLITVAMDPTLVLHIGFQFSALTTASILLFFQPFDRALDRVFATRSKEQVLSLSFLDSHLYAILLAFKKGLALTLAVNITAIVMTLYFFGSFPLFGLIYNLFFPFLVGIEMFLLLLGGLISLVIPPVGSLIHNINSSLTQATLNFALNLPAEKDIYINFQGISGLLVVLYLCLLFYFAVLRKSVPVPACVPVPVRKVFANILKRVI
jgi:competence protein ComEC